MSSTTGKKCKCDIESIIKDVNHKTYFNINTKTYWCRECNREITIDYQTRIDMELPF